MTYRRRRDGRDVVHRWEGNPLITIADLDFKCNDIRNAGAVDFEGETLLAVDIEDLSGMQSVHLARQRKNARFEVEKEPFMSASVDVPYAQHESWGIMDPRITFLEGTYYITYVANSDHGYRLGLAKTKDFKSVERVGFTSEPDTKGGALFPSRIKGRYGRLERPHEGQSIWISYSDDLIFWGNSEEVLMPRSGFWDMSRVGTGPPPIEIDEGWLLIYYGVKDTSSGPLYRLGAAILEKDNPTNVVGRSNIPILAPREDYERLGDTPNIVYSTGAFVEENGSIFLYYGAADSCICVGTTTVEEIKTSCLNLEEVVGSAI